MNVLNNPTELRLGMSGTLQGRSYVIIGRVVMGMEEGGEIWYWNEFNLRASDGTEATLVFEETDSGPQWRFFEYFEPAEPLSVVMASRLRGGDSVSLDGLSGKIDRVDSSKVYKVEGRAPEGVEEGDISSYFNANMGDSTLVVSWAKGEIEHYWGHDLSRDQVVQAFGRAEAARRPERSSLSASPDFSSGDSKASGFFQGVVYLGILVFLCFAWGLFPSCSWDDDFEASKLPVRVLFKGGQANCLGASWSVVEEQLLEYSTAGAVRHGRLFVLRGTQGATLKLYQGVCPQPEYWRLATAADPAPPLSPAQLVALSSKGSFDYEGTSLSVRESYRLRLYAIDTAVDQPLRLLATRYGLLAAHPVRGLLQFEWDEHELTVTRCTVLNQNSFLK